MGNNFKNRTKLVKFREWMEYKKYSKSTIKTYYWHLKSIFIYFDKDSSNISSKDIYEMIQDLNSVTPVSETKHNQFISSFRLYMRIMHKQGINERLLQRPRKSKKLPDILSEQEIYDVIKSIDNIKHKAFISFIYCHGLRISECINFKMSDFDKGRGVIHIKGAKGKKDRMVELNPDCREILIKYYKSYSPKKHLFEGASKKAYSTSSIRAVLGEALKMCNITKNIHVHSLRHSFASHLFDHGVDLARIQLLLGHSSARSTRVYTKISEQSIKGLYQVKTAA